MKIKKHKSNLNVNKIRKAKLVKGKMLDKMAQILEMPKEVVGDNIKITLVNNMYFYLEGSNQIVDYYNHYIKLKTTKCTITLDGKEMQIKEINDNELMIEGDIQTISYNK